MQSSLENLFFITVLIPELNAHFGDIVPLLANLLEASNYCPICPSHERGYFYQPCLEDSNGIPRYIINLSLNVSANLLKCCPL